MLVVIVITMLIALVAIGNEELKSAQHKTQATASVPPMYSTPSRGTSRQPSPKERGYREKQSYEQASSTNDFIELPEEAYSYQGMDLGGMPMYDDSVSDDRFLNDPDDGMSKDSSGFDEEF